MRIEVTGITDVGLKRDRNEDAFLINEELNLFVVADGMGGHAGGQHASSIAVNTVEEIVDEMILPSAWDGTQDPVERIRAGLDGAVRLAGRRIHQWAQAHPEFRGMGTTVVTVMLQDQNAYIAHVGDSRVYLVRDGAIEQVTEDHSFVAQSLREGLITEEEARTHRMRNVITRALGFNEDVEVDVQVRALRRGDRYLLCSDGLSGRVEPQEMVAALRRFDAVEAARQLVGLACARGGDDNITVVLLHIEDLA
ncbi:MAG: Stp1/IreP family PP2C-type Ser/Thr phosphatase [Alphaproteobacteria bacterium]|nr:Stp1/IreP family PP2C-type Ser/Thr phosphatase [Alphaproteobacteria bacterium]